MLTALKGSQFYYIFISFSVTITSKSDKTADATLNNSSAGLQHDEDDLAAEEDKGSNSEKKKPKEMKRRLCNGEIFFIEDVRTWS